MEEIQGHAIDEAQLVGSLSPPAQREQRPRTISEVMHGMTLRAEDGKMIDFTHVPRGLKRRFARQLYRRYRPHQLDLGANRLLIYMAGLRRQIAVDKINLVAEQEAAYLEASSTPR
jgi:hypothetical protein